MDEMIIFTRTFDLLVWLMERCERFPKAQRFVFTKRTQDAVLDFQEALFMANAHTGRTRLEHLHTADGHLNKVRLYLRLAQQWGWLSSGQVEHASKMVAEVGRMLGGWIKETKTR